MSAKQSISIITGTAANHGANTNSQAPHDSFGTRKRRRRYKPYRMFVNIKNTFVSAKCWYCVYGGQYAILFYIRARSIRKLTSSMSSGSCSSCAELQSENENKLGFHFTNLDLKFKQASGKAEIARWRQLFPRHLQLVSRPLHNYLWLSGYKMNGKSSS